MRKQINWEKVVVWTVLVTLIFSVVFVIIMMIKSPWETMSNEPNARTKGDYSLMLLQCVLGILAMFLPSMLEHRIKIIIPSRMMIMYALFLYGAIYLGEVRNFYFVIPYWDTILHISSGGMLGALGFSVIVLLNNTDRVPINLSPVFVAFFAFCFAIAIGVAWEIYEFTFDGLLGLNMQKFALQDGTLLVGRDAVSDTMQDLIVDVVGAGAISGLGYISLKYKKGWVERLLLRKHK